MSPALLPPVKTRSKNFVFGRIFFLTRLAGLCKGSTADSDSVCEGSNPSPAARYRLESLRFKPIFFSLRPDFAFKSDASEKLTHTATLTTRRISQKNGVSIADWGHRQQLGNTQSLKGCRNLLRWWLWVHRHDACKMKALLWWPCFQIASMDRRRGCCGDPTKRFRGSTSSPVRLAAICDFRPRIRLGPQIARLRKLRAACICPRQRRPAIPTALCR